MSKGRWIARCGTVTTSLSLLIGFSWFSFVIEAANADVCVMFCGPPPSRGTYSHRPYIPPPSPSPQERARQQSSELFNEGITHYNNQNYARALTLFEQAQAQSYSPTRIRMLRRAKKMLAYDRALAAFKSEKYQTALNDFQEALSYADSDEWTSNIQDWIRNMKSAADNQAFDAIRQAHEQQWKRQTDASQARLKGVFDDIDLRPKGSSSSGLDFMGPRDKTPYPVRPPLDDLAERDACDAGAIFDGTRCGGLALNPNTVPDIGPSGPVPWEELPPQFRALPRETQLALANNPEFQEIQKDYRRVQEVKKILNTQRNDLAKQEEAIKSEFKAGDISKQDQDEAIKEVKKDIKDTDIQLAKAEETEEELADEMVTFAPRELLPDFDAANKPGDEQASNAEPTSSSDVN